MGPVEYIVMGFGALLAVAGVILFSRMGPQGTNTIRWRGLELSFTGSSLLIFILGCGLFLTPILLRETSSVEDGEKFKTNRTCAFDESVNAYYNNPANTELPPDLERITKLNMGARIHTLLENCGFTGEDIVNMRKGRDERGWEVLLRQLEVIR